MIEAEVSVRTIHDPMSCRASDSWRDVDRQAKAWSGDRLGGCGVKDWKERLGAFGGRLKCS